MVFSARNRKSFSLFTLLSSVLEGTNELWNIITIILIFNGSFGVDVTHLSLQKLVLLWADLLKDIRHHVLKFFGLWSSGNNEKILSDGELS